MNYATGSLSTITGCPDEWETEQIENYLYYTLNLKQSDISYMCGSSITHTTERYVPPVCNTPTLEQYATMKKKVSGALILFRRGDFYCSYMEDAATVSRFLRVTLTRNGSLREEDGTPLREAMFPYHALDTYLPKLIFAGCRVAIFEDFSLKEPVTPVRR